MQAGTTGFLNPSRECRENFARIKTTTTGPRNIKLWQRWLGDVIQMDVSSEEREDFHQPKNRIQFATTAKK